VKFEFRNKTEYLFAMLITGKMAISVEVIKKQALNKVLLFDNIFN